MFFQSFKNLMGEVESLMLGITLLECLHNP